MKIAKSKLQTIIKEEVAKISGANAGTSTEDLLEAIRSITNATPTTLRENKEVVELMMTQLKKDLTNQ
tara:strand:- start:500 stop:703 length:204 start_codon:yes stop_codon:yes gene_type:complete